MTMLARPEAQPAERQASSDLVVRRYCAPRDDATWDGLVARSINGTFLHTRRFLSYHGDRFDDRSLIVEGANGKARGILPAAVDPTDTSRVISHPGITYGGLVHDGSLYGNRMIDALALARDVLAASGARHLRYKVVPPIYHRVPAGDDVYALFRMGARCVRRDLSATIDLEHRQTVWKRRRQRRRHAAGADVTVSWTWDDLGAFWPLQESMLRERFGTRPAHTIEEIAELARRFPEQMKLVVARSAGEVVAGGIIFCAPPVVHLQYSAASAAGRDMNALDLVVEETIGLAGANPATYRYYSFGISTEDEGMHLNDSLHEFKLSFGAGAIVYEHFEVDL
ncbi:MAG: GNAT family N-acetyltransferase [Actinomycetota bacterium]|nr:GNAT family N-acetyltransferase [Actinomycetota bacterium]